MIYLTSFKFPTLDMEESFLSTISSVYDFSYPFRLFSGAGLRKLEFEPITILYGGNGTGKTTALNVIAEKTTANRVSAYNKTNFYSDYVELCEASISGEIPKNSAIITSDDVFNYMLDIRNLNEGIDEKREELFKEYIEKKNTYNFSLVDEYGEAKRISKIKRATMHNFIRSELMNNVREYSNGESSFRYFTEKVDENALYILDEPENSLSLNRQMEMKSFIEESVRFFGCQFIISTHSPFLLSMEGAKIYNLDKKPVVTSKWTELESVLSWYSFFKDREDEF